MSDPTITYEEALYWFAERQRRPKSCGVCIMTCVDCVNLKYINDKGKIKSYGDHRDCVDCWECRNMIGRTMWTCHLLRKVFHKDDKPTCTKLDVTRAMLEAI